MANLLLPLLLGFAITSVDAASLPKPSLSLSTPTNLTYLDSSVVNVTSPHDDIPSGIDPHFGVDYGVAGEQLRPIACLMNALSAMTNLALRDFNSVIPPIIATLPTYPDVVIKSEPKAEHSRATPVRFLMWGLWSLALHMMETSSFRTRRLTLGFNEVIVAYLDIEQVGPRLLSSAEGDRDSSDASLQKRSGVALGSSAALANPTVSSNSTSLSLLNSTTTTTTLSNDNDALRFFITPIGSPLSEYEFFVPIFAGLDYAARFPATLPVAAFTLRPTNTAKTLIEFRALGSRPAMPVFDYQAVVKALWQLAGYMARQGFYNEAVVVIQIDRVDIGKGWLRNSQ